MRAWACCRSCWRSSDMPGCFISLKPILGPSPAARTKIRNRHDFSDNNRTMLHQFPNDENGDVLRRMQENGDDLTKAREIDFTAVFPNKQLAEEFADHFRQMGHEVSVEETRCVAELPWDVIVVNHMLPSHAEISEFENTLETLAATLGGRNDGWGCIEQPIRQ